MHIGLALPQYEVDRDPHAEPLAGTILDTARRAESMGLDGVWLSDHPFAIGPDGVPSGALEPLATLGWLARATSRIDLGTLVLAATMRAPGLVAHTAHTLTVAAPGRIVLGVGAGWYEPEHRAFGLELPPYRDRVARVSSTAQALAALGAARPSILVGGSGTAMLDVAARHADAWNLAWDPPPDAYAAVSRQLDAACESAGRDPATLRRSVGVTVLVGSSTREIDGAVERLRGRASFLADVDREALAERIIVGTPSQCADRIAAYAADDVVVAMLLRDDREMLELFATEVAPALRAARPR